MRIVLDDIIPAWQHAGLDATLISIMNQQRDVEISELCSLVASATSITPTPDAMLQYIADRKIAGALTALQYQGEYPPGGRNRHDAPTGIGQTAEAVWITDASFNGTLRWYVNGVVATTTEEVSVTKTALGNPATGDVVQVAYIANNGTVGWWGSIEAS